jgi:acyl-CoA thioesterase FadM
MNIWVRILITLGRSLFRAKIEPTAPLRTDMIVGPTEADVRFVSNARYLLFMEVGRFELMLRTGILRHARREGWIPLVAAQSIRYRRPLKRFQRFTLTTHLAGWDEKWFFIEHKIERKGRMMAFGAARCCFRGEGGVVAPAVAFAALGIEGVGCSPPGYVLPWSAAEEKLEEAVGTTSS